MTALIYFLLLSSSWAADLGECQRAVTSRQNQDHTDGLIALFEDLLERQILSVTHLNRLADSLDKNKIANPITDDESLTSSSALIHREAIEKFLKIERLDQDRLLNWTLTTLKEKGEVRGERERTSEITINNIYRQIEFKPVPAGEFLMGMSLLETRTRLTNSFEMMSTPVTQHMWAMLMGKNPSYFVNGPDTVTLNIGGKKLKMQPDNPVEQITWWSAVEFANRMSEKMGLKTAYDISGVKFKPGTSAEEGNLVAIGGFYKINAPDGDIYQTEGFRLPTTAEVEYVLKSAGETQYETHHYSGKGKYYEYIWAHENSEGRTHPVAQLKPLVIGEHEFFDLPGHVWIWTSDSSKPKLDQNSIDPKDTSATSENRLLVGGSFANPYVSMRSYDRKESNASHLARAFGVRLVRTLPK